MDTETDVGCGSLLQRTPMGATSCRCGDVDDTGEHGEGNPNAEHPSQRYFETLAQFLLLGVRIGGAHLAFVSLVRTKSSHILHSHHRSA